jgi:hypothetical protein
VIGFLVKESILPCHRQGLGDVVPPKDARVNLREVLGPLNWGVAFVDLFTKLAVNIVYGYRTGIGCVYEGVAINIIKGGSRYRLLGNTVRFSIFTEDGLH